MSGYLGWHRPMLYGRNHQHCGNPFSFYLIIIIVHIIIIIINVIVIIAVIIILGSSRLAATRSLIITMMTGARVTKD